MTPDVKLLVVNFPHNPSGWMPSQQQWQQVVDMTRKVRLFTSFRPMLLILNGPQKAQQWKRVGATRPGALQACCACDTTVCEEAQLELSHVKISQNIAQMCPS